MGNRPILQWTPRSPLPSQHPTCGRYCSYRLWGLLPNTISTIRYNTHHTHHSRTTLQRPFPCTGYSTRFGRSRWIATTTDVKHTHDHQTKTTASHNPILDGERHSTSHYQTTIPTNLTTIGIRSDYPRRCRRQCHISPTTVVDRHRLAIYPTPTYQRNTMDITLDPTWRLRPSTQPTCDTDTAIRPCEGLGNTRYPLPTTAFSLPHHTSTHRPRQTSTTTHSSRRLHMGPVATRQPTVSTLAIPATISYKTTRRWVATHYTTTAWTHHGTTRPLYTHHRTTPVNTQQKHHARQRLAFSFRFVAYHNTLDDTTHHSDTTHTPHRSHIQKLTELWLASHTPWGPPPRPIDHQHMPQLDWNSHLRWARTLQEPTADQNNLDPSICWAIDQSRQLPNIHSVRQGVISELQDLVDDLHDQTQHWFDNIPRHCQQAYQQSKMITQIPALIYILQQIQYPHTEQLQFELSQGFPLLGALHPGLNWHVRTDQKYTTPTSIDQLRQHNQQYIHNKLQQHRIDPHWQLMAKEIATEVQQGRMAGPFHGPTWLQQHTTPLLEFDHTSTLLPLPHPDPIIAMAFSIEQTGSDGKPKIRRGEDWRRSGHNQACQMTDQPYHHTPDHYTWLAQYTCKHSDEIPLVWGHDHDGAYRQLPLSDPSIAYVLLLTPTGPTLWHHHVLLFGSAASVWAYNRFGDMLSAIARTITCIPVIHYVDDYGSIEPPTTAQSGFDTFEQINSILGFHMKKSKRQPPDQSHRIQGVIIRCEADSITVAPCQDRVQNISQQLLTHLQSKSMTPEQARKLAGKCSFTTTHLFGRVGRAALRALYDKAFSNNDTINSQTQSAIIALLDILNHCQPRQLPLRPHSTQHTIIYTDAFYKDGDKQLRCHDLLKQEELTIPSPSMTNGWAAVVFHPDSHKPLVFNGTVPPKLLKHFASNKAFIYFLEAWAAIITPILVKPLLTPTYIQLCDNDAATHAIIKGSGSHAPLNNLLGSHWTWHNRHCLRQILRRVPTHANIADPFSREDFTIAEQLHWPVLEPPTSKLLETTKKIIGDSKFAHQTGFTKDPYVLQFQSLAYQKLFPTPVPGGHLPESRRWGWCFLPTWPECRPKELESRRRCSHGPLRRVWTDDGSDNTIPLCLSNHVSHLFDQRS